MLNILLLSEISPDSYQDIYNPTSKDFNEIVQALSIKHQSKLYNYVMETNKYKQHRKRKRDNIENKILEKAFKRFKNASNMDSEDGSSTSTKKSLRERVMESISSEEAKEKVLRKVKSIENSRFGDGDAKAEKYVDAFLKIPFKKYHEPDIVCKRRELFSSVNELNKKLYKKAPKEIVFESQIKKVLSKAKKLHKQIDLQKIIKKQVKNLSKNRKTFIETFRKTLDSEVHGHNDAKESLERVICQWTSGSDMKGNVIALEGPPGNGKTSLVKAISQSLKNRDGKDHPYVIISLGGLSDSNVLLGHSYTYVGSEYGKISKKYYNLTSNEPNYYTRRNR